MKRHFNFYKAGPTWVLSVGGPRLGLIHLGSRQWWKPLVQFPLALVAHFQARDGNHRK